ncbi:anhydro-N-acetylmuramic acid kinase [Umezawaea sp. Da 62-37]|uniref:anhydro-N-acetylmuramic acid kinase n=1 Tax=Umezawaea sp. Da 62-37 TaxID=3075927 RepID=UPI0028F74049|nr:anhydro-N-acetylmuramic acid kinase [Umezawaea sp. Da 62-37]WNV89916.1 anhydro-N-acetylmuramic acid kinase [Umezawaea sp. Da 62-37]
MKVIGVISGTSMDAIDVALADLRLDGDTVVLTPLGHAEHPFPADVRTGSAAELCRADTRLGQAFAAAAVAMGEANLVASLGQTVHHWVEDGRCLGTLQLGQPAWIAEATGLPVVADLRARDVAAGGHGAPLASTLDALWLADLAATSGGPAVALNIGGIANITVVAPGADPIAYDTGPGNALLDAAVLELSHGLRDHDVDGELASRGTASPDYLAALLADPYYALPAPKSTGKEHFDLAYLHRTTSGLPTVRGEDLMATLTALTALTIADACREHGAGVVVGSGGGLRNPALVAALTRALGPVDLVTSDSLGLPSDAKEAYLSALLGFLTWSGVPSSVPTATGATGPRLLGSVTPGREPLRLPEPAATPVTRLRIGHPGGTSARP